MTKIRLLALVSALLLLSCVSPSALVAGDDPDLARLTAPRLERFASESDFLHYLRDVRSEARARNLPWASDDKNEYNFSPVASDMAAPSPPPPAPPPPPPPPGASAAAAIVVTGTRVANEAPTGAAESITNVQTHGVDEGDIVKKIGRFLIVLQDGRLFAIDTRPASRAGLVLVDRINVYRNAHADTWYDEMLVYQNRVVVTGYSYARAATEISVFSLSPQGLLARETVYYMTSNDYYDIENYSTRLVDDKLVIYSPLDLTRIAASGRVTWPVIRRWVRGEDRRAILTKGEPLFDARDIYRPTQPTLAPTIHSISVCPLGSPASGDELECAAVAFIGPPQHEFYIAPDGAYLWLTQPQAHQAANPCAPESARAFEAATPAALYRAPFDGGAPGWMNVRGAPRDQLGFASTADEFRALLVWNEASCPNDRTQLTLKYFHAPLSAFLNAPPSADPSRFIDAPSLNAGMFEERFTDDYVVYGARETWGSHPPEGSAPTTGRVVALRLADPTHATVLEAPHNIIRVERAGANAILTGYRNDEGLSVSLLDLSATPAITATTVLAHRYESEGRSHAFNAHVDDASEGLMGLPTVHAEKESGRLWFRSNSSDVSFLSLDHANLAPLGELRVNERAQDRSYACEVSCVDWYGNTRPIFTDGRVFALTGVELIEGAVHAHRIRELRRVNLSAPPRRR